jgi:hypothetical protein
MQLRKLTIMAAGLALATSLTATAHAAAEDYRAVDISTHYAWFQGDIYWDSASFRVSGTIHDTPQRTSHSWARIAYKHYYDGGWHQKYSEPDPFWKVGNGGGKYDSFTRSRGTYKDVWIDLCSERNGATECTGWS